MTHGSLFSGIGGFEEGAELSGIETLWNCEYEPFQRKILKQHYPNSIQYEDVRTMQGQRYVDIISGGFPCQDISVAGKGVGIKGQRSGLWSEMYRILGGVDQNTQSLKTAQCSLFEDSSGSYMTFPKSGMMLNGSVYQTPALDSLTKGRGFTLLPTPTKSESKATYANMEPLTRYLKSGHQIRLADILCQKGFTKCQRVMLLETVMGFQIGHTELEVSETA